MLFRRGLWCHLLNLERTAVRRALSFLECHLVSCLPGIWAVLCLTSCKLLSFSHDKSIAWLLSDVYCLIFQFSPCWSLCISGNTKSSLFSAILSLLLLNHFPSDTFDGTWSLGPQTIAQLHLPCFSSQTTPHRTMGLALRWVCFS